MVASISGCFQLPLHAGYFALVPQGGVVDIGVFLLIVLVVVGPTALVIWSTKRKVLATRSPAIEAEYLSAGFDVASTPVHGEAVVSGTLQGVPFVLTATITRPKRTMVTVPGGPGRDFQISRAGSRDSTGRDLVESMFPDAKGRGAVRALFHLGFDTVESGGGNLRAIKELNVALLPLGALRTAVGHLSVLRDAPLSVGVPTSARC